MSRYNPKQLKAMAQRLLIAKRDNDERYFQFLMSMAIGTNQSVVDIEFKINEYANARA